MNIPEHPGSGNEVDLGALVKWVWVRRLSFAVFVLLGGFLFASYSYIVPKQYTAHVLLLPKIPVQKAGILGPLASLAGATMSLEGVDEELYGRILHSNLILNRVVARRWPGDSPGDSLSLFDLFGLNDMADERGSDYAGNVLKDILRVQVVKFDRDPMNGVMKIQTTVPENPVLAASLANYLADELEAYNSSLNNQRKYQLRDFLETRLVEIQAKLEEAEADITRFLQNNERYSSSPKLLQRYGELDREVQAYRSIWLQLRSKLENANIDVNEEIDSINILDRATPPFYRSAPKRRIYLITGFFVGFLFAVVFGKLRQLYGR